MSDTAKWQLNVLACTLKHGTFSNFFSAVALPTPQAQCGVAAGYSVKKQKIPANFPTS